ncbi:hypothetical protein [Xylanimonas protaetiae]|uniref:Uncharacterized protein n=1 Tax=Xylanimonas protaetiae TaxID=2509457 RepID=A0A4P6F2F8_9MICO|nr:hypothetical protein [Xylanimonas protaetiae]QAY69732.1 hypothetical protein ET471_06485 [Xylanimonas protaetiae]
MSEHPQHGWWHRLSADVQRWLKENPRSELTTTVFDAVIGAGGPYRADPDRHPDELPDARLLSDDAWEYIKEQPHPDETA